MGFSSWLCLGCGNSVRAADTGAPIWMSEAVVITKRGKFIEGLYDGYGQIEGVQLPYENAISMYHHACWVIVGAPRRFTKASPHADDQGFFTGYKPKEPKTMKSLQPLRRHAATERIAALEGSIRYWLSEGKRPEAARYLSAAKREIKELRKQL